MCVRERGVQECSCSGTSRFAIDRFLAISNRPSQSTTIDHQRTTTYLEARNNIRHHQFHALDRIVAEGGPSEVLGEHPHIRELLEVRPRFEEFDWHGDAHEVGVACARGVERERGGVRDGERKRRAHI